MLAYFVTSGWPGFLVDLLCLIAIVLVLIVVIKFLITKI